MLSVVLHNRHYKFYTTVGVWLLEGEGGYLPETGAPWALRQPGSGRKGALRNHPLVDLQEGAARTHSDGLGEDDKYRTPFPRPATAALPFSVNITCSSMYSYLASSWDDAHGRKGKKQKTK